MRHSSVDTTEAKIWSEPPALFDLGGARPSSSSRKMIEGARAAACSSKRKAICLQAGRHSIYDCSVQACLPEVLSAELAVRVMPDLPSQCHCDFACREIWAQAKRSKAEAKHLFKQKTKHALSVACPLAQAVRPTACEERHWPRRGSCTRSSGCSGGQRLACARRPTQQDAPARRKLVATDSTRQCRKHKRMPLLCLSTVLGHIQHCPCLLLGWQ